MVRHAPTAGNLKRRYVGVTDEPLCAQGMVLAHESAKRVSRAFGELGLPRVVYVSPLARARQTASALFPDALQRVVDDLGEMNFGVFEGRTYEELKDDASYQAWLDGSPDVACPRGESQSQFVARTCRAMRRVLREAAREEAPAVAVVAHGGTIMATFSQLACPPRAYFDWHAGHCQGFRAQVKDPLSPAVKLESPQVI